MALQIERPKLGTAIAGENVLFSPAVSISIPPISVSMTDGTRIAKSSMDRAFNFTPILSRRMSKTIVEPSKRNGQRVPRFMREKQVEKPTSPVPPVRILLVDDRPENLIALEASLENIGKAQPNGFEVFDPKLVSGATIGAPTVHEQPVELIHASSGQEALRHLLNGDFAVILLDVQMPGMDGYETATLIRQRPRSQHTPIIFLTAISMSDSNVFHGYALGAVDYIFKPFDPEILRAKLSVFIDLYRQRQAAQRMADEAREQAELLRVSNSELAKANKIMGELYADLEGKSTELSQERDFVDKIFETAGSYIIIFDAEGRIERFNQSSEAVSGLKAADAKGQLAWETLVSGEDAVKVKAAFGRVKAGHAEAFDMHIQPQNGGKPRRLSMTFTGLYNEAGKLFNVIASGVDISERYEAEEKVRRMNEELEQSVAKRTKELRETNDELRLAKDSAENANRAKDQFLAVLSHELRTPLTPILTIVEMLSEDPVISADTKTWIETIGRNAQLEARLIDDLLDLTRITNGKLQLHTEPVELHQLISDTLSMCAEEIRTKKLSVSLRLAAQNNTVLADPARMHQILWNILKNAIKFTPEEGSIAVHTEDVARLPSGGGRVAKSKESSVLCQIRDTGIGIAPDQIAHVFDAFAQGGESITRKFGGLGLGLAISKALIEQHGGTIRAESNGLNAGSTFTIELPVAIAIEDQAPAVKSPRNSRTGGKEIYEQTPSEPATFISNGQHILLVEDNSDTSDALQALLERRGFKVVSANSVQSAIEIGTTYPYDIVISDIGLPDGDGRQVIERLNKIRPARSIAISGFGMDSDIRRSLAAGFSAHLVKPVQFEELMDVLGQLPVGAVNR